MIALSRRAKDHALQNICNYNTSFDDHVVVSSDDITTKDSDYSEPMTPKSLGKLIEKKVIDFMPTSCCGARIKAAKPNQIVYDGKCSQCLKKIQIKSTSLSYKSNQVCVTKPSKNGTLNSPVSIYKFQIHNGKICKKRSKIFSPDYKTKTHHYIHIRDDRWGNPIIEPSAGTVVKSIPKNVIRKIF